MQPALVREARQDDIESLEALDRRVWDETTTPTGIPTGATFGTRRPLHDTWVAEMDGQVAGFVTIGRRTPLESNRHVAALRVVAVAPERQGTGVGTLLVRRAIDEARRRGHTKLSLTVLGSNERAMRLYQREGFVIEGRLRDEFDLGGRLVDDVVMARRLAER